MIFLLKKRKGAGLGRAGKIENYHREKGEKVKKKQEKCNNILYPKLKKSINLKKNFKNVRKKIMTRHRLDISSSSPYP